MADRHLTYFASDVHLGLNINNADEREKRFVAFLNSIPVKETDAVYLLGDIWDFWYEYHDVVPMGFVKVFSSIINLIDNGVKVYFMSGNHDLWSYHYFENLGIKILPEPYYVNIGGKMFCMAHGDGLGPGMYAYKLMKWVFHSRFFQILFSFIHPWLAFRIAKGWSKESRLARRVPYKFRGEDESLYKWAVDFSTKQHVDYFIFGHYHTEVDLTLPTKSRLLIMKDWVEGKYYLCYDSVTKSFIKVDK